MGGHETVGPGAKLPRQTSEPSDYWPFGLLPLRTSEPSDYCTFGLVNCPRQLEGVTKLRPRYHGKLRCMPTAGSQQSYMFVQNFINLSADVHELSC